MNRTMHRTGPIVSRYFMRNLISSAYMLMSILPGILAFVRELSKLMEL